MTRSHLRFVFLACSAHVTLCAGRVVAGPVIVNNPNWYEFIFNTPIGSTAVAGTGATPSNGGNSQYADSPPWTFSSVTPVRVTVTDAFLAGDSFNLLDFGILKGTTPAVPDVTISPEISNPAIAMADPRYSHGVFALPAGPHSLSITLAATPHTGGADSFRVDSVPEPSGTALAAAGLGAIVARRRRRDDLKPSH